MECDEETQRIGGTCDCWCTRECVKETQRIGDTCDCRCTRECDEETQRIGGKIGGHITNTSSTKNRIVRNSQNPEKGVGYLKEAERIPLGALAVGYDYFLGK